MYKKVAFSLPLEKTVYEKNDSCQKRNQTPQHLQKPSAHQNDNKQAKQRWKNLAHIIQIKRKTIEKHPETI